ncbi:MAG TPA: Gfo/Idh/MocA family oxidoreductase, partial [Phycisphaerae bacterium]|nr:Gfo/Idh/MocA family oxidoreductase [Phycisphaerae bacterium]
QLVDKEYGNSDCKVYNDIREFLAARKDIDAVLIATGDRWHALASILAMRAGKDVFSEKPSSMTIAEGQAVVDTAKRHGRVYQTGTQRLSEANFVYCIRMAQSGKLGKVHTARAHIAPWESAELKRDWLPAEPEPPKDEVDWDGWLGPCPMRPYNSAYVKGAWRGHYDFHTSCIGEWGAHTFAQAQAGLNMLDTSPVEYEYTKNPSGDGMVTRFADGVKMILHREGWWRGSCGMRFEGTEGWVSAADKYEKPEVSSPALLDDFKKIVDDYMAQTGRPMNHVRDFLNCVKSRRPTVANAEVMHHSMSTVHAANICMWLKRDMKYDPAKQEFVNDAEANKLRSRVMRAPWTI